MKTPSKVVTNGYFKAFLAKSEVFSKQRHIIRCTGNVASSLLIFLSFSKSGVQVEKVLWFLETLFQHNCSGIFPEKKGLDSSRFLRVGFFQILEITTLL